MKVDILNVNYGCDGGGGFKLVISNLEILKFFIFQFCIRLINYFLIDLEQLSLETERFSDHEHQLQSKISTEKYPVYAGLLYFEFIAHSVFFNWN